MRPRIVFGVELTSPKVAGVGVVRGLRWVAADGGKRAVARVQRAVMGLLCRVGEGVDGGQP